MKILVACEFSNTVSQAFRDKGHEVYSCDLLDTWGDPKWHFKCDVREVLNRDWDMIIAHPPCQYLTNAGVRWLHTELGRWERLEDAKKFFKLFLHHSCPKICIENPTPHKYAELPKSSQIIQPWHFGHKESKATHLWLKGLSNLKPTNIVGPPPKNMTPEEKRKWNRVHYESPGKDRWMRRSVTFKGLAEAMANQWI